MDSLERLPLVRINIEEVVAYAVFQILDHLLHEQWLDERVFSVV